MQTKERLDLANHFAAGGIGLEDLIKETKEGPAHAENALPAVGPLIGLRQQAGGQEGIEQQLQVTEALLAKWLKAAAQRSQAGTPNGEKRRMQVTSIYTCQQLDHTLTMAP